MNKLYLTILLTILFTNLSAKELTDETVSVFDCGPLENINFGVVISSIQDEFIQIYFTEGYPTKICPEITSSPTISGKIESYCNYSSNNCEKIKVFHFEVIDHDIEN